MLLLKKPTLKNIAILKKQNQIQGFMEKDAFRSPDLYHQHVSSDAPTRSYPHSPPLPEIKR